MKTMHNQQGGAGQKSRQALTFRNTALENGGGLNPENPDGFWGIDMGIAACYPRDCVASSGDNEGERIAYTNIGSITSANVGRISSETAALWIHSASGPV